MLILPDEIVANVAPFAPLFAESVFRRAELLLVGAILTPGRRTVCAVLRTMGLAQEKHFQNYHRVLNRARWSALEAAHVLLLLLVAAVALTGVIVLGIDETLERRRGQKIGAKGLYRDAVRSSKRQLVKASGLRWVVMMLLVEIPWAGAVWALPFLTVLAPPERYHTTRGQRHKKLSDWARQMILQVRRWLPNRKLVVVGDGAYAVLALLWRCSQLANPVTMVTRLRLDAGLYEPAPPKQPGRSGRPRKKGKKLPKLAERVVDPTTVWERLTLPRWYRQGPRVVELVSHTAVWYHKGQPPVPIRWVLLRDPEEKFEPQALLCTDLNADPAQILRWFLQRWQLEVTFQEVRTHLGVETQRQWNELAILRETPALMGLFSLVTLMANQWLPHEESPIRQAAWYRKERPTFSDALALVRRKIWAQPSYCTSLPNSDRREPAPNIPALFERFMEAACYTT